MSFLSRVTNGLFGWVSPRKTIARREKPFKASEQLVALPETSRKGRRGGPSVSRGRRSRRTPSNRSSPRNEMKCASSLPHAIKEEGNSPVESKFDTSPFHRSSSVFDSWSGDEVTFSTPATDPFMDASVYEQEDSFDANENTKVLDEDKDHAIALHVAAEGFIMDREAKIRAQQPKIKELMSNGWNEDTIKLYMLIERRTYESLFPAEWFPDFPLFPGNIFTNEPQDALLGPLRGSHLSAVKAIQRICRLGIRVRDSYGMYTAPTRRSEALIKSAIKRYIKWAYKDAGLTRDVRKRTVLPLIEVVAGRPDANSEHGRQILLRKLQKLSDRHLNDLIVEFPSANQASENKSTRYMQGSDAYVYEPPTLYGIYCYRYVAAVVAYEPLSGRNTLRHIAFFSFSNPKYDVWNALGLALVITYSRNHMLNVKKVRPIEYDGSTTEFEDVDA